MKLIMTKGLPGSGKTTWAKKWAKEVFNTKRINKDDLRAMLDDKHWSKANEGFVLEVRDYLVELALSSGINVIVDDTNLHPKHEKRLSELAAKYKAEFEIKDFTDIPIEVCIERDLKRFDSVGEAVIRKQYNQFLKPKIEPRPWIEGLSAAILCDIDGTLALFGEANPYKRDFSKDELNTPICDILWQHDNYARDFTIILLSGRSDEFRGVTEEWLQDKAVPYNVLFMRKEGDTRKDSIIKEEIYRAEIENKYNVLFVLDDRLQVCRLWHSLGLTLLRVGDPDADF